MCQNFPTSELFWGIQFFRILNAFDFPFFPLRNLRCIQLLTFFKDSSFPNANILSYMISNKHLPYFTSVRIFVMPGFFQDFNFARFQTCLNSSNVEILFFKILIFFMISKKDWICIVLMFKMTKYFFEHFKCVYIAKFCSFPNVGIFS